METEVTQVAPVVTPEVAAKNLVEKLQASIPETPENQLIYKFLFDNLIIYIQSLNAIQKFGIVIETPQMVRSNPAVNPYNESQKQVYRLIKLLNPNASKSELDMDLLELGQ